MPKISVRDNENSRWKRNAKNKKKKQTKTEKSKGDKSYNERVRALSELWKGEDFVVHLS